MCNIAGFLGNRPAAPILLEMLRRQQYYDGDMSTGIATIHEGKLHYRKIVGDVDTLIRQTDALSLPGTVGIAHTRPSATGDGYAPHPQISRDGRTAIVTNGTTPRTKYCARWDEAVDMLERAGFRFPREFDNPDGNSPKLSRNGKKVNPGTARNFLLEYYMDQGKTLTQALALACAHMYTDNVTVLLSERAPDTIYALRTTRPMTVVMEGGETYMATCRYAFPDTLKTEAIDLPLFRACAVRRDGVTVSSERMDIEPVSEMTPYTYHEGYRRIEALLKSDQAPLYFDDLEFALDDMRDLWPGDHTYVQHARLVYDLLRQFDAEGRLRREVRIQERANGTRHRWYFRLED